MRKATQKQINTIIVNWVTHPDLQFQLLWKKIPKTNEKYKKKYKDKEGDYSQLIIEDFFKERLDLKTASLMIKALLNYHDNYNTFKSYNAFVKLLNSLNK